MSPYIVLPLFVIGAVATVSFDVWVGFKVSDMTEGSGFSLGFYCITVFGLIAMQISAFLYFAS